MSLQFLAFLALIQGITEFLPISSSAHLILPQALTDLPDQGPLIDVSVHVGTLFAVMLYFRKDMLSLLNGLLDLIRNPASDNAKLFLFLVAATIPTIVVGGLMYATGLVDLLRDPATAPMIIAVANIVFGLLLWYADRKGPLIHTVEHATFSQVMWVGVAQVFALIPGTSRSGVTMTAARWMGLIRVDAARLSLLLSIPTIAAFGLLAGIEVVREVDNVRWQDAGIAVALSFIAAYVTLTLFMKMMGRISFTPFVIYRLVLGAALCVFVFFIRPNGGA